MRYRCIRVLAMLLLALPLPATAQQVRIDKLVDLTFGLLASTADVSQSRNVCISGNGLGCILGNDPASLVILLCAAELGRATAGSHAGTFTLLIAAE